MHTLLWVASVAVVMIAVAAFARYWGRTGAPRLITCPESHTREAVELDPLRRVTSRLSGRDEFRLRDCSRWPERQDCGQQCLSQITEAPDGCRVRSMLDRYYAHERCALCGHEFGDQIDWYEHEPAFIDGQRQVLTWKDVPLQALPDVMESHLPLCWDCRIVETVRQRHPERVTDRLPH